MADDRYRKDYPVQPHSEERARPYYYSDSQRAPEDPRGTMAASVTLPSIDSRGYGPPSGGPGRGYPPPDPRYPSPSTANGYPQPGQHAAAPEHHHQGAPPPPPPAQHQPAQPPSQYPPLPPPGEGRPSAYPPPDPRGPYYDDRRPSPYDQYPPRDPYYGYGQRPPPPGPPPPNGYPGAPPPGIYEFSHPQGNGPAMAQAAPRQRTSIACKYCRKRKIRCSGYQSAPGGKCQNCARMNQECIFQPVSSSSSTAFIPVSAVPGGVPPGTQLFGAYGQPLAPNSVPAPPGYPLPPPPHQQPYYQAVHSPTGSYSSYGDPRGEDPAQLAGRRRRRTSEEQDDPYRLPPPRSANDDDPRRRSPAEHSSNSSPGTLPPYLPSNGPPPPRQSPRTTHPGPTLPQPQAQAQAQPLAASTNHASSAPPARSPTVQAGSSGASTPARQGQPPSGQSQQGSASVMNLSNLIEKNDIDKTMIDRLNRPRDVGPGSQNGSR